MECTEAITRLPTFYGAMQLAHPAQPDEDVKFLPYIAKEKESIPPKLFQYAPEDLNTAHIARRYKVVGEKPRNVEGFGVSFIGQHEGTLRVFAEGKQGFFSL